jgi:hypothetical protein
MYKIGRESDVPQSIMGKHTVCNQYLTLLEIPTAYYCYACKKQISLDSHEILFIKPTFKMEK